HAVCRTLSIHDALPICSPQPLAVVLDEFQYLGAGEDGLAEVASAINATFERVKVERPFALVMSGSAVSTMESLAAGGAPLYGRRSEEHTSELQSREKLV